MVAKISDVAEVQGGIVLSRKEAKTQEESYCSYKRLTLRRILIEPAASMFQI